MKLKSYQRIVELNLDGTKRKYVKTPAFGRPGFFEVFPYIEEKREEAKNGTNTEEPPKKIKKVYRRPAKGLDLNNHTPNHSLKQGVGRGLLDPAVNPFFFTTAGNQLLQGKPPAIEDNAKRTGPATTESHDWGSAPESGIDMWGVPPLGVTAERIKNRRGGLVNILERPSVLEFSYMGPFINKPDVALYERNKKKSGDSTDEPPTSIALPMRAFTPVHDNTRVVLPYILSKSAQLQAEPVYEYRGYPYSDKEDFMIATYNNWYHTALKHGDTANADNFARFAAAQDAYESGYGTSNAAKDNNLGGMRYNGKNIKYKTIEDYYNDKYEMFKKRMPHVLEATTNEDYINALNAGVFKYAPHDDGNADYENDWGKRQMVG